MYLLDNHIMPYAWGSSTAIAELQGRAPQGPEAELWLGAHPQAPSRLRGRGTTLAELIAADPIANLGAEVAHTYADRLPFLTKVLAAAAPLSLQAHPSKQQAELGFARENALGLPLNAPNRCYRDDNHKPELICALTPFRALCGFRAIAETQAMFAAVAKPGAAFLQRVQALRSPADLRGLLLDCLAPASNWSKAAALALAANAQVLQGSKWYLECEVLRALGSAYPGDPGILVAALLNAVELAPGEALYLPAGNMHAYLAGVGVEIMASSDNVLRGGLTPKHVDVGELSRVLVFDAGPVSVLQASHVGAGEFEYRTAAREFQLSRIDVRGTFAAEACAPEILLVTTGHCEIRARGSVVQLARGASIFLPALTHAYALHGTATVFRSRVPD